MGGNVKRCRQQCFRTAQLAPMGMPLNLPSSALTSRHFRSLMLHGVKLQEWQNVLRSYKLSP